MSSINNKIFNNISDYYESLSYYNRYFKDIWFSIIFIAIIIGLVIYFYIKIRIEAIRKEWPAQRCNPVYIPFAGMIHQMDGKSKLESGQINFMYCQSTILNTITGKFFSPVDYLLSIINNVFKILFDAINNIRNIIQYIRQRILEIIKPLILKIMDVINPLTVILIYVKDIFLKGIGILKTVLYTVIGYIFTVTSVILNFYKIVRLMMLLSLAGTIALWATYFILNLIPIVGTLLSLAVLSLAIISTSGTLVLIVFTIILSVLTAKLFKKSNRPNPAPPMPDVEKDKRKMNENKAK